MPNNESQHVSQDFGVNVTKRLNDFSKNLQTETATRAFCVRLSGELVLIQAWLEGQHPSRFEDEVFQKRLAKLLGNYETLCKWSKNTPKNTSSVKTSAPKRAERPYAHITRILAKNAIVPAGLRDFAHLGSQKHKEALLKIFKNFTSDIASSAKESATIAIFENNDKPNTPNDHIDSLQELYQTLSKHCICLREGKPEYIVANLRLKSCCDSSDSLLEFCILFLDHPHRTGNALSGQWQDTRIRVSKKKRGARIAWEDEKSMQKNVGEDPKIENPIDNIEHGLCGLITNRESVRLSMVLSDGKLMVSQHSNDEGLFMLDAPSIPLSKIIRHGKISQRMRILLGYLLAKAIWQFYDSNWMAKEWSKESVHFMLQRQSGNSGVFVSEPFLHADFNQILPEVNGQYRTHHFPKVLALGIMLLEIELSINIEDHRPPSSYKSDGSLTVNADSIAARRLYENESNWKQTLIPFRKVIGACLIPSSFEMHRNDIEKQRQTLYQNIVVPLETMSGLFSKAPELFPIPPVASAPAEAHTSRPLRKGSVHMMSAAENPMKSDLEKAVNVLMASNGALSTCETWFTELDRLNSLIRAKFGETDLSYKPVRVAVLDTGVSKDHNDGVIIFKDFVNPDNTEMTDNAGHGTSIVRLTRKVFNKANVYVGRTFKQSTLSSDETAEQTQSLIAKAIRYAVTEWQVDVITMASGFENSHVGMRKAIEFAAYNEVLVFAAASNYSSVRRVAFPGRMKHDVMCMFSTDAGVKNSRTLNPAPRSKSYNFAILGEDVSLGPMEKPLNGTSFATAIGAALAARIIDFSRHTDCQALIEEAQYLKTTDGMSAIFALLASGGHDGDYHCIAPWRLLEDVNGAHDRTQKRAEICGAINRALKHMDDG